MSGLAFREGTHELYSAGFDRTVKLWSLDDRAYVDSLFGHQAEVLAIDLLRQVGAEPKKTCRLHGVAEKENKRRTWRRMLDCTTMN